MDFEQHVMRAQRSWTVGINAVVSSVTSVVRRIWKHASVEPFGSFASGLWLPSSDVDLVIKVRSACARSVGGGAVLLLMMFLFLLLLLLLLRHVV
jgi:DNA polymerase sigma